MVLLLLRLPLYPRLLSSLLLPQLLPVVLNKSLSLVPLMLVDTSTVLLPKLLPEECSTLLLTPLPTQLNPPLQLSRKPSTFNLPLLLPNTSSRDKRLRLVLSPSLWSLLDLLKVQLMLGCVRLPLSAQLTPLSELLWSKVLPLLLPPLH